MSNPFATGAQNGARHHPSTSHLPTRGTSTLPNLHVEALTPVRPNGRTIIMVHGSMHTGGCYLFTPDGRDAGARQSR